MTNLFDALEFCLREIEEGGDMETALARFPEYDDELRPILETSVKARAMASPEPSPDVVRRSRARVMQHAAELRESRVAPRNRRVIPLFQRLAISFTLTALLLMSGNGLLSASASALPGEKLYPVKRGWENIRLFFIFDSEARKLLEDEFENERLHEANELLAEGRHEVIEFAGVFMQVKGVNYISGLQVILPVGMPIPANGDAVIVSGRTNAQGFVEIISLELLPAGSVVPTGSPIEMEVESDSEKQATPPAESSSGSGNEAGKSAPQEYEIKGTLEAISTTTLVVNGMTAYLDDSKIYTKLCIGMEVELYGYYAEDGKFIVLKVSGEGECGSSGSGTNIGPNSTNENTQGEDSGENDNEENSNDDPDNENSNDVNDNTNNNSNDSNDNNHNDDD